MTQRFSRKALLMQLVQRDRTRFVFLNCVRKMNSKSSLEQCKRWAVRFLIFVEAHVDITKRTGK
jgi:chorismate mutase